MPYRITSAAEDDLLVLYDYGRLTFGPVQAEAYYDGLMQCFALLAEQPSMERERCEIVPPVRVHFHKAHVVIYLVQSHGVLIVRVVDGRQNWVEHFRRT